MTNETKKRIEAYKRALPEMRERVTAVALLLVMSISMMVSASFAWLTISRRPEVTGVSTTVAANGNLEIALATGEVNTAEAPDESQVGDSSAAKGQSVVDANVTWGNLVNLADPSYGLDNLTLRPAQLNYSALLVSPLYGAVYKGDGRVEKLNSSFAYSTWDTENQLFMVSDKIGVRAISSTTVEAVGFAQQVKLKREDADTANSSAGSAYISITMNKSWMDSLAVVMGTYMTAKMNATQGDANLTNPTINQEDVKNLTALFGAFVNVYELQFEAMAKLANYQLFLKNNSETGSTPYTEKTAADMKATTTTEATLKNEGLQISGLNQAKSDYSTLVDGWGQLETLSTQGNVKWVDSGLNAIVNSLMNVGTCTLDGTPINNIGVTNATGYLDGQTHLAVITNGVLFNFEKMNGNPCNVEKLTVSAKVKRLGITIPASISANIKTNAPRSSQFYTDLIYADSLNQGAKGVEIAQDTYGLAVDLWVRTNASGSYLTLEGNVLTKSETVRAIGKDVSGNQVELYTVTRAQEETAEDGTTENVTYTLDLYQIVTKDENDEEVTTWYNATSHATVALEEGETPAPKMEELITVIGFEGENRVWEDADAWENSSQLSLDATTQGSGSSYVYYADSPEDQARSLKLLEAMNVAFVDDKGTLMATAIMDTERFYAENGRVTVPLVLRSDSLEVGTNDNGDTIYAITPLVQNEPKRITAIVYLDGTKLTNQDVLAASDIQGKLNIQFGSSVTLSHAEDETLLNATRSVSATIDKSSFKYDESIESGMPMTTTVTLNVDGDEPTEVTAFFIRAISSTQGSREEKMTFRQQPDGSWKAAYTFTAPGNYILRSVELDGQTYDLAECPTVTIEGFTVNSLECTQAVGRHVSIMTAAGSSMVDLKLQFASDNVEAMPTTVQGRFLREGDGTAVNINFTYNAGGVNKGYWTGQATFISSGEYTLEYLVLNGEYAQLDDSLVQTATVYLGMKTAVYTDSPIEFKYVLAELADNEKNLYMKVKIMDNTGAEMEGLQDAHLYYLMEGSSIAENGFSAPLTWDGAEGYYTCTFTSKVGVFKFSHVTVGSNTITYAEDSPVFRVMSPNPPEFVALGTSGQTLYHANRDGVMEATFDYSATAEIMALIRKDIKDNNGNVTSSVKYYVMAEVPKIHIDDPNRTTWTFKLPNAVAQDGYWTMEELYVWEYYTEDGKLIDTELKKQDGSVWDYSAQNAVKWILATDLKFTEENSCMRENVIDKNYWKKIVETVNISFAAGQSKDFTGKNFLESYEFSGLNVDFTDFQGQPIVNTDGNHLVKNVKLTFTYSGNSGAYGGYTSDDLTQVADGAIVTVDLKNDGSGTHFVQDGSAELLYAGTYTTTFTYEVGASGTKTESSTVRPNMPVFTVSTNKPTVKVTGVSPTGTFSVNAHASAASGGGFTEMSGVSNGFTDYYACVYIRYTSATMGTWRNYAEPSVTLTLSNISSDFESATMTFGHPTASYARTYTFGPGSNLTQSGEIGHADASSFTDANPALYFAGKQMVEKISVVRNSMTFSVDLSHEVTINQPQYPPYVTYKINDTSYTGSIPPNVYSSNGETITLTLPTITSWNEAMSTTENQNFVVQSGYPATRNVYTQRTQTSGCSSTTYYTPYIETTTVSKASSSTTTWTRTHTITGWKIGNTTYAPGETVTVTGNQTVTAVISTTDGEKTTTSSTTTRTEIVYTLNGSESTTNPGGTSVTSVEGSTTDVVN